MLNKPSYNLRVIEYENGMVEIRKYQNPINAKAFEREPLDSSIVHYGVQLRLDLEELYCEEEREYKELVKDIDNSFLEDDLEFEEEKKQNVLQLKLDKERSIRSSVNRTVNKVYSISRQCNWEFFLTFTFDNEKVDRYDYDLCVKRLCRWLEYQKSTYALDLQYLFVPELHKDGAIHFHGLVANIGLMDISFKGHFIDRKKNMFGQWVSLKKPIEVLEVGGWKYGFSNATKVLDVHKVSTYITKYITKDLCIRGLGKKRYFASRNIPKPNETYFLSENIIDDLNNIIDSFGFDVSYQKKVVGDYQTVEYIFLDTKKKDEREVEENV